MNLQHAGLTVKSTVCGKGLFSQRKFRKGQSVGHMQGTIVSDDRYDPDYCVDMGKRGVLDPEPPFRYLNHSCEPNCELVEWETEGGGVPQIWVHVVRTIRPGDQLTIDYCWHADAAIPCLCGSPRCRGYIVDPKQLPLVKRRRRS